MNYIQQYLQEIRAGRCIVSKRVRRQYEALEADINNPESPYIFDQKKAERPIQFIERFCKHSKGEWAGKPVLLELFQKAYISALFGFIDRETGEKVPVEVFVAILPCSQLTYVEAVMSQKKEDFIHACENAF